jgi:hypothetical protein
MINLIQKTIFSTIGTQMQKVRKEREFHSFMTKVKESPVLFLQVVSIPAIIHHVFFKWLITIGPILYFLAGVAFTIAFQLYCLLIFLNVPSESHVQHERYFTTDKDVQDLMQTKKELQPDVNR